MTSTSADNLIANEGRCLPAGGEVFEVSEPKRTLLIQSLDVLSRQDLYHLVWSIPIQKLAHKFRISDKGLAKICHRRRIPTPPRGHWQKLEAGRKSAPSPLPELDDAVAHPVDIEQRAKNQKNGKAQPSKQGIADGTKRLSAPLDRTPAAKGPQLGTGKVTQPEKSMLGITNVLQNPRKLGPASSGEVDPAISRRASFDLDDMMRHEDVLEKYCWLSGHILNRWRRTGAIRHFRSADGKLSYPRQDLNDALVAELRREAPLR